MLFTLPMLNLDGNFLRYVIDNGSRHGVRNPLNFLHGFPTFDRNRNVLLDHFLFDGRHLHRMVFGHYFGNVLRNRNLSAHQVGNILSISSIAASILVWNPMKSTTIPTSHTCY